MSHVPADPLYLNTFEGSIGFSNPQGTIQYFARVEGDTLVATQSYFNSANQFPPANILYAPLAADAIGDTTPGTPGQWLDLTGSAITYSDTKIFVRLSNVGGGWPTIRGLEAYVYAFPLVNPDSLQLSVVALVYVNIPFVLSPGLYRVNLADTSFSRIADVQSQTSGTNLYMACDISDLTSQPDWPVWPPEAGYIITSGLTLSIVSLQPNLSDYLYPSFFLPGTGFLNASNNQPPMLSDYDFDVIRDVSVIAHCQYYDPDNNLPVEKHLFFDRGVFEMGSFDHSYNDTSAFIHTLSWPGYGIHYFYFRFSDGADTVETPWDSLYIDPSGIVDPAMPIEFALSQNYPNPFNSRTQIDFNMPISGHVTLSVYDILGNRVRSLLDGGLSAGPQSITWDGQNNTGQSVSSGIYLYQLGIDNKVFATKRMLLLK
jgi:hypothetical protein